MRWWLPALLAVFTAACADDEPTPGALAPPQAFVAQCAVCHGPAGGGLGDVPSLATAHETWEADGLVAVVRNGLEDGTMPAFPPEQLSDDELDAIVTWLAELGASSSTTP